MIILKFHVWISLAFVSPNRHYSEVELLAQLFVIFDDKLGRWTVSMGYHDFESCAVNLLQHRLNERQEQIRRYPVGTSLELLRCIRKISMYVHTIVLASVDFLDFIWTEKERWKNDAANKLSKFYEKSLALEKVTSERQMLAMPFEGSQRKIGYRGFLQAVLELGWRHSFIENFLHINCPFHSFVSCTPLSV
jgi:hypothetical protein